ncbi:MAG: hypothetical protein MH321_05320 [Leptospiraceae bacterium]|nr:hypothetical protein [Leptospiraceae bacterium]
MKSRSFIFLLKTFILFAILPIYNCFDYEETIIFKKGYSGTVEITYSVPLKEDKKSSMIRFLPTQEAAIQEKINQGMGKTKIKLRDYQFRILEKGEFDEPFFDNKGKVSYKIDFQEISELERMLPGNMITKFKGKSLVIKREFPSFSSEFLESTSVGEKKIINETGKLLKEGKMNFRILFPSNTECYSNKGTINLGSLNYVYPLSDSLEAQGNSKLWEIKLRIF